MYAFIDAILCDIRMSHPFLASPQGDCQNRMEKNTGSGTVFM